MTKAKRITWTVEKRKLADLKEHENNPRQFTEKGMKDLENSINSIGFMQPININQDGTILSGHARTKKLKDMGEVEVDVYVPDRVLTPKQEEEVLVRANANTAGQWDFDILANNFDLEEITDWGLDVPDMDLDIEEEAEAEEDEVPELKHKFAVKGDLFELIDEEQGLTHRVLCGDSTMIDDVEKVMNGEKADMVFTDPPYGVSYQSNSRTNTAKFDILKNDNLFITEWIDNLPLFSKGFVFVWTSWKVLKQWIEFCEPIGELSNLIIWDKGGGGIGDLKKTFSTDFEIALVYNRGAEIKGKRLGSVWGIGKDGGIKYLPPTQKPVELAVTAIKNITIKNQIILDFFLGSGSTLIACQQTKRNCYGIELDEHYCGVIVKRWLNYMQKDNKAFKIKRNDEDFDVKEIEG